MPIIYKVKRLQIIHTISTLNHSCACTQAERRACLNNLQAYLAHAGQLIPMNMHKDLMKKLSKNLSECYWKKAVANLEFEINEIAYSRSLKKKILRFRKLTIFEESDQKYEAAQSLSKKTPSKKYQPFHYGQQPFDSTFEQNLFQAQRQKRQDDLQRKLKTLKSQHQSDSSHLMKTYMKELRLKNKQPKNTAQLLMNKIQNLELNVQKQKQSKKTIQSKSKSKIGQQSISKKKPKQQKDLKVSKMQKMIKDQQRQLQELRQYIKEVDQRTLRALVSGEDEKCKLKNAIQHQNHLKKSQLKQKENVIGYFNTKYDAQSRVSKELASKNRELNETCLMLQQSISKEQNECRNKDKQLQKQRAQIRELQIKISDAAREKQEMNLAIKELRASLRNFDEKAIQLQRLKARLVKKDLISLFYDQI